MLPLPDLTQVQAVVFDLDGTLVDSEGLYRDASIHTMCTYGGSLTAEEYYLRFAGNSEQIIDDLMHADLEERLERPVIRETRYNEFVRLREIHGVPIMPGVLELLDLFDSRDLPLGVASAAEMRDVEGNLQRAGIRGRFVVLASCDEVPETKPAPDVYLLAAERMGVDPGKCLSFEDTNSGARAAITAGMQTYMVPHECEPDDFVSAHARGILASLQQVPAMLGGS